MTVTKKFTREYLVSERGLPDSGTVENNITDHGRWTVYHEIVFEDGGEHWKTTYGAGATESQDEEPWQYETEVECTKVELRDVTVQKWCDVG